MPHKDPKIRAEFFRQREARRRQQWIDAGLNSKGQQRRPHFITDRRKQPVTRTDEQLDREALAWLEGMQIL
jgi:hypothetical protein